MSIPPSGGGKSVQRQRSMNLQDAINDQLEDLRSKPRSSPADEVALVSSAFLGGTVGCNETDPRHSITTYYIQCKSRGEVALEILPSSHNRQVIQVRSRRPITMPHEFHGS